MLPISTTAANALGTGAVGIGSPLKAVTGPDEEQVEDAGRKNKRSRLSDESDTLAPPRMNRRANTTSPVLHATTLPFTDLEASPGLFPLAATKSLPRTGNRSVSAASATKMTRASSAGSKGTAMGRTISASSETLGRERTKREIVVPERLRDYIGNDTLA